MIPETLEGWQEIHDYTKRSLATLKRYKKRGLPIVRSNAGHPILVKSQYEQWIKSPQLENISNNR